jgi:hypothetical protein
MDVLALILACSLHPDDAFVRTMVGIQSGGNPLFVGDLVTLKTHDTLSSVEDAMRVAEDIAEHGGRPAVGLLGVPVEWGPRFGRGIRDLFDGCTNLEIGSAMFSQYAAECSPSGRHHADHDGGAQNSRRPGRRPASGRALRSCILTKLSRALGLDGKPTVVLKRVARAGEDQTVVETTPPPQLSAVFSDGGGGEDWSSPRLYFNPEQPRAPPDSASRPMPSNEHARPKRPIGSNEASISPGLQRTSYR